MISRAAHAGQILTIGMVTYVLAKWVKDRIRLLALSWADVHEWTETKYPAAGHEPVDGAETHPSNLAR